MKVAAFRALVSSGWSVFRPALANFFGNRRGSIAIYVGFVITALMGASVIVFDIGRLAIVRTQVQNAADAAAMAGAYQLDGRAGARARAEAVARDAAVQTSGITMTTGGDAIVVDTVEISQSTTAMVAATTDRNAVAIRVTIVPRPIDLVLEPVLAMLTGATATGFTNITADATATSSPMVCDPPPLMICNTDEIGLDDLTDETTVAGKQILLRDGGNSPAPGNFGLLCPPSEPNNCGAGTVEQFLAAVETPECSIDQQSTKTGVTYSKVNNGINSRFDMPPIPNPAEDIVSYLRDSAFSSSVLGNGNWNRNQYWNDEHGTGLPGALNGATRRQAHLYEMGEGYARKGKQTVHPLPADTSWLTAQGYTIVTPPGPNIPAAGVPVNPPVIGPYRRVMKAAVVQCQALGVIGNTDIDLRDMQIIEVFFTEPAESSGANKAIVVEVVRTLTSLNSADLHTNIRLLD